MNDFSLAWRQLRKAPVFTAAAALSIALGIGANTAVFTLVNEFLLRSLPVKNPNELVLFRAIHGAQGRMSRRGEGPGSIDPATGRNSGTPFSLLALERLRAERSALSEIFAVAVNTNGLAVNFFESMKLPLILGRGFTPRDDDAAPRVAVVNQTFARAYFGADNPVGRQLVFSAPNFAHRVEIVGVARDAKYTDLRGATPATVYFPALQQPDGNANFAVRTANDPSAMFSAIRDAVRNVDPTLPVLNLRTQDEQIDRLHGQERLFARLAGVFGLIALVLACVGIHGLLSHAVSRRRGEIGLRMALGARPEQVVGMVVRESVTLACLGIALGLGAAYGSGRLIATMLFGVSPIDPVTYGTVTLVLIGTVALASLLPALRASRIEPLQALRAD